VVVKAGRRIKVRPFYGWGWSDSQKEIAWDYVPAPFEAVVEQGSEIWSGKVIRTLRGMVRAADHPLDGFEIQMSGRHDPWDGDVNITLESEAGRELAGYGSINLESFE
jgi:hypothetical protein